MEPVPNQAIDLLVNIIREEVGKVVTEPPTHRLNEFWTDPSSQQFSMSRACFGALIFGILGLDVMATYRGLMGTLPDAWLPTLGNMNTAALVSVAGVYGFNSVVGAAAGLKDKVVDLVQKYTGAGKDPGPFPGE